MKRILLSTISIILLVILIYWFYPSSSVDMDKYSDPDYAKHVELQAYLMTPEQVAELFASNPNGTPNYWTVTDAPKPDANSSLALYTSYFDPLFLVIRMKNTGTKSVCGLLTCKLPAGGEREVPVLCLKPNEKFFQNQVMRIYSGGVMYKLLKPENPSVSWSSIYTNCGELR